jgi:hypothetical protein
LVNISHFKILLGVNKEAIIIKKGFPPKPIDFSEQNLKLPIQTVGIKNKEAIILEID